jgi:hypothetical protein
MNRSAPAPELSALHSALFASEAELAGRWAAGLRGALRLADGRGLRIVFPGVPGGGSGPDFRGAILDAGGDLLRGDVEIHLLASGWRAHGHHADDAYAGVVLHVVALNDGGGVSTAHASGRAIPLLVVRAAGQARFPPPFTPPCALLSAQGRDPAAALERLGLRRLRIKAARVAPLVACAGAGQALYQILLETLAGPANRAAFAGIARQLPLAALLERAGRPLEALAISRSAALAAELRGAAAGQVLRRAGLRPLAAPGRRLDGAAALFAHLWPKGASPCWPPALVAAGLAAPLRAPGLGRAALIECRVNAILPVALAAGVASEAAIEAAWLALPSPATYGRLRRLESWLAPGAAKPFTSAARLQGGLLLHADYCTKGMCGRCPLSS